MLRISKKVEYGLLSLQYMAHKSKAVVSAKEIAEQYDISFEFLAKTMQSLARTGFIHSYQGVRGGYVLACDPDAVSVGDIIKAIEGRPVIVECVDGGDQCNCQVFSKCTIKNPMHKIQEKIDDLLGSMTLTELVEDQAVLVYPL